MPLDSTNCYTTLAFANAYFATRLDSDDWTASTDKETALIQATRELELLRYVGTKTDDAQALKWPRKDAFDENGIEYANDVIPTLIQQACCEFALALIVNPALMSGSGLEGFSEIQVDRDTRFKMIQGGGASFPDNVSRFIGPFIVSQQATTYRV